MGKRVVPARTVAKVGNYAAPVDTAGLDPEMKATMGFGGSRVATPQKKSLIAKIVDKVRGK